MVFRPFWVAWLHVGEETAEKITSKHHLRVRDVRDEVVCRPGLRARPDCDPERGLRYYIDVVIDGRDVVVVIKPHRYQVDEYILISAFEV